MDTDPDGDCIPQESDVDTTNIEVVLLNRLLTSLRDPPAVNSVTSPPVAARAGWPPTSVAVGHAAPLMIRDQFSGRAICSVSVLRTSQFGVDFWLCLVALQVIFAHRL